MKSQVWPSCLLAQRMVYDGSTHRRGWRDDYLRWKLTHVDDSQPAPVEVILAYTSRNARCIAPLLKGAHVPHNILASGGKNRVLSGGEKHRAKLARPQTLSSV